MLMEIFQLHNDQLAVLVEESPSAALENYNKPRDHARAFLQWKYSITDINIKRRDYEFVSDFEFWLFTTSLFKNASAIQICEHVLGSNMGDGE